MTYDDSTRITDINLYKYNVKLKAPFRIANHYYTHAENVLVRINTNKGIYGFGEASPAPGTTGDTQNTAFEAGKYIAKLIKNKNPLEIERRVQEINKALVNEPQIKCAFDEALYDILGKTANLPLYALLGGEKRELFTDFTIGIQDSIEDTLSVMKMVGKLGIQAIKLKTGINYREDIELVKNVREVMEEKISIRIDSNQGWDYPTAVAALKAMEKYGLEYSEQPLPVWDDQNMCRLRKATSIPLCADESVWTPHDAFKLASMGACDYLNIKLGKSGGLHNALKINAVAESCGMKCMIGCFHESRLSLSVSAHLASARPNIVFLDLDSGYSLAEDPISGGMKYDTKKIDRIILPTTPGHGADVKEEFLSDLEKITI